MAARFVTGFARPASGIRKPRFFVGALTAKSLSAVLIGAPSGRSPRSRVDAFGSAMSSSSPCLVSARSVGCAAGGRVCSGSSRVGIRDARVEQRRRLRAAQRRDPARARQRCDQIVLGRRPRRRRMRRRRRARHRRDAARGLAELARRRFAAPRIA